MSVIDDRRSYMLHPHYAEVLLESTNVMDHIVTFKGVFWFYLNAIDSIQVDECNTSGVNH